MAELVPCPSPACGSWDCPSESTWLFAGSLVRHLGPLSKHSLISLLEKEES